jgi:hypothetical protein
MKNGRTTMIKRFFALVLAFAVAVSILTVPVQESYAAGGKVKTVAVTNLPAKQLTLKKGKSFTLKTKVSVSGKRYQKQLPIRPVTRKLLLLMQRVRSRRRKKEPLRLPFTLKQIRKRRVRSR